MIKIAYIIDTIESPTGGTEKQLLMLIKHLDRSRFQPYLCVLRSSNWLEKEFNLCPLFVSNIHSFKSLKGLMGVISLAGFFKKKRFDIVQTHFRDASIAGITAARFSGIKAIVGTRRNQGYWMKPSDFALQKFLDKWVTCYVANSQSTKKWQVSTEGVDKQRIHVINNGFEFAKYQSDPSIARKQIRAALDIPQDSPVITIVANLRDVKDHSTFLRAAQIVSSSQANCHYFVVGSGTELGRLKTLSSDLDIAHAVYFLGERRDIPDILAASDIGVLSSQSESFSNALVEYMAAGLPVVTTDVGGAREAVDEDVNGFVVPIGNCEKLAERIAYLLRSERIVQMGLESRKMSLERFSVTNMIEQTERLYISIMDEGNR